MNIIIDKSKLTRVILPTVEPPKSIGVGDTIAKVMKPFIKASDKILHTHLEGCKGCSERKDKLNKILPYKPAITST